MKTFVILSLMVLLGAVALVPAQQPYCRSCSVTPGLSNYSQAYLSTGYAQPDYYNTHHRHVRDIVRLVDVAQINPAYVSSYVPGAYDATTQADILGEIRRLSLRIDQLNAQVAKPGSAPAPAPAATAPLIPNPAVPLPAAPTMPGTQGSARVPVPDGKLIGLAVLTAKCAACHQEGHLLPEQRFTLLDAKSNVVTLTDKQKIAVSNKTRLGQMPPPKNTQGIPPLTDAEYAAVADLLGF